MATPYAELVAPADVATLLGSPSLSRALVVVDARYWLGQHGRGLAAFEAGHLPGARFVDVDAELAESPATSAEARPGTHPGGRHPRPTAQRLAGAVRRLGIDADSTVLVHEQQGSLSAAWFVWLLRDAGFTGRLLVLDGGFAAWQRSGGAVSTDVLPDAEGTFVPRPGHLPILDADEVPAWIAAGHQVVDVRAAERFRGESEPVDPVAGHIPGAKNLPLSELQNPDGTFLSSDDLARRMAFLSAGDALSCGSGLTASLVFLAASVAGVDGLRLYPGSWSDWISDPTRPVAGLTT